ncbi:MAG: hypothetical protein AB7E65_06335, partial [Syntrophotalea sp.]
NFHVWAVDHIDDGLEILTGIPAGQRQADGSWPEGTMNFMVNERLLQMVETLRSFGKNEEKNDKN